MRLDLIYTGAKKVLDLTQHNDVKDWLSDMANTTIVQRYEHATKAQHPR